MSNEEMTTCYQRQKKNISSSEAEEKTSSSSSAEDQPPTIKGVLSSPSSDYLILSFLGEGTFGQVVKCIKQATNETVAVKMFKERTMTNEAVNEVNMLEKIRQFDPDRFNFVRYNDTFMYQQQMCIEFEMLQISLFDFVRKKPHRSLTVKEIRPILHQVAITLDILQTQAIVHTDLKPDNIMLVDHAKHPLKVKVIDFGLACHVPEPKLSSYIQAYVYRAPEVILGIPFTSAVDMWSLGCIAAELFLGSLLFPGSCEYNMLQRIIQTRGQIPQRLLKRAVNTKFYFRQKRTKRRGHKCWWTLKTPDEYGEDTEEERQYLNSLDDILKIRPPCHLSDEDTRAELEDQEDFVELLKQMLHIDADKRIGPSQLLQDPFITMKYQAENYPTSLYFKSCCEAMEVCRDQEPHRYTDDSSPAWENYWEHPLILDTASALSTSLHIHEDQKSPQPEQLTTLANDLQEPMVNEDASRRGGSEPVKKRSRSSSGALLHPKRSLESLLPAKKKARMETDFVTAETEVQTDTSSTTVSVKPMRKRTWDTFTAQHPNSRSSDSGSPIRKKIRRNLDLSDSKEAPSEALSEVPVRCQMTRKRKRNIDKDHVRNRSESWSPEIKRRKIELHCVSQKAAEPLTMSNKSQKKRKRSEDRNSPERKKRKRSLCCDSQQAQFDAESINIQNDFCKKSRRNKDMDSQRRKRRKIGSISPNSVTISSTTKPQNSAAVAQTVNRKHDNWKGKRKRK
ncbi:homeodomain-interacting protein kinase 2 [Fundulus heteroclitus]|uniref:homeodomain-interacting protein kinase 2 n=1 Tax=Fundulus heteroclitus TaxID=8078 RepID=UPI00165C6494|nr:homeodomain-interacting protein kinase 2 [Fundulus heteroclitus]